MHSPALLMQLMSFCIFGFVFFNVCEHGNWIQAADNVIHRFEGLFDFRRLETLRTTNEPSVG